jgi:DNA-binding response OmpR family regulator
MLVPITTGTVMEFNRSISTSNKRILIVDDEEDIAEFFKLALEQAGFIVDMFNDPLKSLSHYRAGIYDLLLLDVRMPQLNGFELYNKIRQIENRAKVCFMTAFEEYYDEFERAFPDLHQEEECFINKPIGMAELIITVKSHLN